MLLDSFTKAWDFFVSQIEEAILLDNRSLSAPALRCLEKGIKASADAEGVLRVRVSELLERSWQAMDMLGSSATKRYNSLADMGVDGKEWDLPRLTRLMAILKGVLTYPNSPDYRPDIDALPPVQAVVMNTVQDIDLTVPGSPSLVMRDLSEYATLPFLAAFDVVPHPRNQLPQTPQKRITYISLSKKTMPLLVDLFLRFKSSRDIYVDGTLESVLSAYSIPIKLKYDCPAPAKYGKDLPLWKTATTCFLRIVKECTHHVKHLGEQIPDERVEGIWRQILDVFKGGVLADCSTAESFPFNVQEAEENFDLALVASLEIDVVPHLGDPRVSDVVVAQLGKILQQGRKVYESDDPGSSSSRSSTTSMFSSSSVSSIPTYPPTSTKGKGSRTSSPATLSPALKAVGIDTDMPYPELGSSNIGKLLPRERFSYWRFDLLFLICSDVTRGKIFHLLFRHEWRLSRCS
ncbi:hypothetical protein NLJ89_g6704 [Agrocybe chaxingu]|uniref:Uncharacterized protein n=1 Tax=Agrocybe chaxingu TaxID=84603 RepID=A0A9W8JY93_9AGAR|nr:hypothetical protein NLJ89_g6704 [Agrocybe chaxingu]